MQYTSTKCHLKDYPNWLCGEGLSRSQQLQSFSKRFHFRFQRLRRKVAEQLDTEEAESRDIFRELVDESRYEAELVLSLPMDIAEVISSDQDTLVLKWHGGADHLTEDRLSWSIVPPDLTLAIKGQWFRCHTIRRRTNRQILRIESAMPIQGPSKGSERQGFWTKLRSMTDT